jgi:predicted nucleic acid-binding Zn ribbon protein
LGDALRRTPADTAPLLAWPLACGTAVAERTRPIECSHGVLRVQVPDASWRTELQALAPKYLAVINRYVSGTVTRIEFVISPARRN